MRNHKPFQYFWRVFVTASLLSLLLTFSQASLEVVERLLLAISMNLELNDAKTLNLTLQDGETQKQVIERVSNSNFSLGLKNWDYIGHAQVITSNDEKYIQLGDSNSSNLLNENCIIQEMEFTDESEYLGIRFKQFSIEECAGFDPVAWVVLLNNKVVFVEPNTLGNELNKTLGNGVLSSDWRWKIIKLDSYEPGLNQVKICAGNSGDRELSSWVQVSNVTTRVVPINPSQTLTVSAGLNHRVGVSYLVDSNQVILEPDSQHQLSFTQAIHNNELQLNLFHSQEEIDQETIMVFVSETEPPAVTNLQVFTQFNLSNEQNYFLCGFPSVLTSADTYQNLAYYPDVRHGEQQFTVDDWPFLSQVNQLSLTNNLSLLQPVCFDGYCWLKIQAPEADIRDFFAIKNCDITGRCSSISEVVSAQPFDPDSIIPFFPVPTPIPTPILTPIPTPTSHPFDIVLNEIMFNPLGDDRGDWLEGEWIELYNQGDQEMDLKDWIIQDSAGWQIQLLPENCDGNNDITDGGETSIPAKGYLLAFTRGRAIFNNSGDSVYLLNNEGILIDQVSYPGSSIEDLTYGRLPDGSEEWVRSLLPTPLQPNLKPD